MSECFACLISVISLIGMCYLHRDAYVSMGKSEVLWRVYRATKAQQRIELQTSLLGLCADAKGRNVSGSTCSPIIPRSMSL